MLILNNKLVNKLPVNNENFVNKGDQLQFEIINSVEMKFLAEKRSVVWIDAFIVLPSIFALSSSKCKKFWLSLFEASHHSEIN